MNVMLEGVKSQKHKHCVVKLCTYSTLRITLLTIKLNAGRTFLYGGLCSEMGMSNSVSAAGRYGMSRLFRRPSHAWGKS